MPHDHHAAGHAIPASLLVAKPVYCHCSEVLHKLTNQLGTDCLLSDDWLCQISHELYMSAQVPVLHCARNGKRHCCKAECKLLRTQDAGTCESPTYRVPKIVAIVPKMA